MTRRALLSGGTAVVAVTVAAVVLARGGADDGGPAAAPAPAATATVERTTLLLQEEVDGTLGYGQAAPQATDLAGKVTAVTAPGTTVERGGSPFAVDGTAVVLLYGSTPFHRTLQRGDSGPDVQVLEQNLLELGFGEELGGEPDEHYDGGTAEAVRSWQSSRGAGATGTVPLGTAVVAPGPVRVAEQAAALGSLVAPGAAVLAVTGTTPVVTVDLEARKAAALEAGDAAQVELADGRSVAGTVESVGTVARASEEAGRGDGKPTVPVTVRFADPAERGGLDGAPVEVTITRGEEPDVLAVPVEALLALREGGFGVEVVDDDGTRRVVTVETGGYAQGKVAITGDGVTAGTTVTVPA